MGITSVCLGADEKEPVRKVELQESQDTSDKSKYQSAFGVSQIIPELCGLNCLLFLTNLWVDWAVLFFGAD